MLSYLLFRLAGMLAPHMARRLGYAIVGVIADLVFALRPSKRRMIQRNVRHVLGERAAQAQVNRTTRRIFHNLLKNYFDLFWLPAQKREAVAPLMHVEGMANIEQGLSLGKGAIVVSAHLGNQEVMAHVDTIVDYKITVVAEHLKNERLFQYVSSLRQASGIHIIAQDGALKEIFRALKRNEIVCLVYDRDVTKSGRVATFFSSPVCLPDGYAVLSLKLGAPIVPAFVIRMADDSYTTYIEKPILLAGSAKNDDDVRRVMTDVGVVVEQYIENHIDQWVYFHDVWGDA